MERKSKTQQNFNNPKANNKILSKTNRILEDSDDSSGSNGDSDTDNRNIFKNNNNKKSNNNNKLNFDSLPAGMKLEGFKGIGGDDSDDDPMLMIGASK